MLFLYPFHGRRPRPRARTRPRPRPRRGGLGGLGLDVRVDVRRTEARSPSPIFVHGGDCIGVRDVANTSARARC